MATLLKVFAIPFLLFWSHISVIRFCRKQNCNQGRQYKYSNRQPTYNMKNHDHTLKKLLSAEFVGVETSYVLGS